MVIASDGAIYWLVGAREVGAESWSRGKGRGRKSRSQGAIMGPGDPQVVLLVPLVRTRRFGNRSLSESRARGPGLGVVVVGVVVFLFFPDCVIAFRWQSREGYYGPSQRATPT